MRKKDVWAALFCAAALGIGLYCLWGWNRSIEVGFTVLTTQPDPQDLYDEDTQEQTDEEIEALKGTLIRSKLRCSSPILMERIRPVSIFILRASSSIREL